MGQFPVISISLKGGEGRTFDSAKEGLKYIIGNEAMRFQFLTNSEKLSEKEKTAYKRITEMNTNAEMYLLSVEDFREKENYHIVPVYAGFCV